MIDERVSALFARRWKDGEGRRHSRSGADKTARVSSHPTSKSADLRDSCTRTCPAVPPEARNASTPPRPVGRYDNSDIAQEEFAACSIPLRPLLTKGFGLPESEPENLASPSQGGSHDRHHRDQAPAAQQGIE